MNPAMIVLLVTSLLLHGLLFWLWWWMTGFAFSDPQILPGFLLKIRRFGVWKARWIGAAVLLIMGVATPILKFAPLISI